MLFNFPEKCEKMRVALIRWREEEAPRSPDDIANAFISDIRETAFSLANLCTYYDFCSLETRQACEKNFTVTRGQA
jgi:hypothetical protein